ncbi:hypothetical protein ACA910_022224 [Epithemia clementina (nom. ined.)]
MANNTTGRSGSSRKKAIPTASLSSKQPEGVSKQYQSPCSLFCLFTRNHNKKKTNKNATNAAAASSSSSRSSSVTLSALPYLAILLLGYFLGTLQSNHYCASLLSSSSSSMVSYNNLNRVIDNHHRAQEQSPRSAAALLSSSQRNTPDRSSMTSSKNLQKLAENGGGLSRSLLSTPERSGFCQRMAGAGAAMTTTTTTSSSVGMIPSALELWFQQYQTIHRASQLSTNDFNYKFHDFTADLLHLISPRLPKSTVTLPQSYWKVVRRILQKLERRIQYLQQQQQQHSRNTARRRTSKSNNNNNTNPHEDAAVAPPPVHVVILGGSVLVGRNCRKILKDLNLQFLMPNRECTYSFRLQVFLDLLSYILLQQQQQESDDQEIILPTNNAARDLTPQLFQVTKIAMGGTNTAVGSQIFHYDLLPEEARNADIVINGYATNDMHILTILEMQASGRTLREGVFDMLQDFVRNILQQQQQPEAKPCQKPDHQQQEDGKANDSRDNDADDADAKVPLLIHLDDYLGNEQREILQTMELSQSVSVLAQYYGFSAISYSNLVRDWVYGDSHEFWFSPEGWWPPNNDNKMEREIHPGMGAHVVTSWIIVYNLLHIATTYCTLEPYLDDVHQNKQSLSTSSTTTEKDVDRGAAPLLDYQASSWASRFVPLDHMVPQAPGRPRQVPPGMPPKLTPELSLEQVSELWQQNARQQQQQEQQQQSSSATGCSDSDKQNYRKCPFSWVGGLSLQQNNKTWINEVFSAHTVSGPQTKWQLVEENGKVGFLAKQQQQESSSNEWVLEFQLPQAVSTLTLFYLRSYGDKWKNSRIQVSIHVLPPPHQQPQQWSQVAWTELLGTHAKNTSEMYTHELSFSAAPGAEHNSFAVGTSTQNQGQQRQIRVMYKLTGGDTFKLMGMALCR